MLDKIRSVTKHANLYKTSIKADLVLATGIVILLNAVNCFGQTDAIQKAFFDDPSQKISERLFLTLKDWKAVPNWDVEQQKIREDWLESLHKNVVGDDWPKELRQALAGTLPGGNEKLGLSTPGDHRVIGIYDTTPAYLSRLMEIVNYPMVFPRSSDPNARMLWDRGREVEAVNQLAEMLGMLRETSYLEGPTAVWRQGVIAGTRFIYYHELGHLVLNFDEHPRWKFELHKLEQEFSEGFAEELYADRYAFIMLLQEVRSHPNLQSTMMTGVALAMALVASQEFFNERNEKPFSPIAGSQMRMRRLLYWAEIARNWGDLEPRAFTTMQNQWDRFKTMLQKVTIDSLPTPVFNLLQQASEGRQHDWESARNQVVKWCSFGECLKVADTLNKVCGEMRLLNTAPAKRILQTINYILMEARKLEPLLDKEPHNTKPHQMEPLLMFANRFEKRNACSSAP